MRRRALAPLMIAAGLLAGACAGGDSGTEPATPAENVDPTSDNVITGPINKAKSTADDAEARYQQLEEGP